MKTIYLFFFLILFNAVYCQDNVEIHRNLIQENYKCECGLKQYKFYFEPKVFHHNTEKFNPSQIILINDFIQERSLFFTTFPGYDDSYNLKLPKNYFTKDGDRYDFKTPPCTEFSSHKYTLLSKDVVDHFMLANFSFDYISNPKRDYQYFNSLENKVKSYKDSYTTNKATWQSTSENIIALDSTNPLAFLKAAQSLAYDTTNAKFQINNFSKAIMYSNERINSTIAYFGKYNFDFASQWASTLFAAHNDIAYCYRQIKQFDSSNFHYQEFIKYVNKGYLNPKSDLLIMTEGYLNKETVPYYGAQLINHYLDNNYIEYIKLADFQDTSKLNSFNIANEKLLTHFYNNKSAFYLSFYIESLVREKYPIEDVKKYYEILNSNYQKGYYKDNLNLYDSTKILVEQYFKKK